MARAPPRQMGSSYCEILVALGQVRVEVVLAGEDADRLDGAAQRQPGPHRQLHHLLVERRQHAGHAQADRADVAVGLAAELGGAAAEDLGPGEELGVDLEPEHHLPAGRGRRGGHGAASSAAGAGAGPSSRSSARAAREQGGLVEGAPHQLQPDRQAPGQPAGHREAGQGRQVAGDGEDVGQVHLQRVAGLLAQPEGRARRHRPGHHVAALEGGVEVAPDQGADLLGPQVVGVVVAGAERVGAQHDAPLDLGAEPLLPALGVELLQAGDPRGPPAEAHAVVARQVGRGLGGGDEVVGGDAVPGVGQGDLHQRGAQPLVGGQRLAHPRLHLRLQPRAEPLPGHADAQAAGPALQRRQVVAGRPRRAGLVVGVGAGDGGEQRRHVPGGAAQRAELVERGGEGDDAVAGDPAVGGLQPHHPAEGGRQPDRAAGVGAEGAEALARRQRRRAAARGAARGAGRGPTGCGRAGRPSSRWTSPWRTRPG